MKRLVAVLATSLALALSGCSTGPTPTHSSLTRDEVVDVINRTLAKDPRSGTHNNPWPHEQAVKLYGKIADDIRDEGACRPDKAAYWQSIQDYDETLADAGRAACRAYLSSVE